VDIAEAAAKAAVRATTALADAEAALKAATTLANEATTLQERAAELAGEADLAKAQDAARQAAEAAQVAREKEALAAEAQRVKNQLREAQEVGPHIAREVSRAVNTTRGICAEPAAVKAAGFEPGSEKLSYVNFRAGEHSFRLGGKVDGRLASGEILEVKQRQNRFLNVPIYERIQVQVYMMIFNQAQCTLREHFKSEFREHIVARDDAWFGDAVRCGLETYAVLWARMMKDVPFRVEVLRAHPERGDGYR
jgi:multidrug efflux pump subunit AcrA (membrane-fusion protein)